MINVCITVFNRYDLLARLFASLGASTVQPDEVYVIDRGNDPVRLKHAANGRPFITVPLEGQSLPAAWNWFMSNVEEERVIVSDDIEFFPETLETFLKAPGDLVGLEDGKSSHFACFAPRNSCIKKVGFFDESLSPDYMYFEDSDYGRRMLLLGIPIVGISCMHHGLAQSWEKKTEAQRNDHHRRFMIAQDNYIKKWGGIPGKEKKHADR